MDLWWAELLNGLRHVEVLNSHSPTILFLVLLASKNHQDFNSEAINSLEHLLHHYISTHTLLAMEI